MASSNVLPQQLVGRHAQDRVGRSFRAAQAFGVTLCVVLVSQLPYLYLHFVNLLLLKPHYQFLVLMPFLLAKPFHDVLCEQVARPASSGLRVMLAFLPALLAGGGSIYLQSPWLAALATILAIPAIAFSVGGTRLVQALLPAWVPCWLFLPPPFAADEKLILWLRNVATMWSSSILDVLGVVHRQYANIIDIPGERLFVADACSGIHSLFVLIAAAFLVGIFMKRSLLHTALLCVFTFGIVLAENVSRLVSVAVLNSHGLQFSSGWRHESLGMGLFCCSLMLVLSADQLLHFLLAGRSRAKTWKESDERKKVPFREYKRTVRGTLALPLLLLLGVGFVQVSRMPAAVPRLTDLTTQKLEIADLEAHALPPRLGNFAQESYEHVYRTKDDPMGEHSQVWVYQHGEIALTISMDYPYSGPHDLCVCFEQTGWNVSDRQELSGAAAGADEVVPFVSADISDRIRGGGLLFYSQFSDEGDTAVRLDKPDAGLGKNMLGRLTHTETDSQQSWSQRWIQIEAVAVAQRRLTDQEREELQRIFLAVRSQLFTRCLAALNEDSSR